MNDMVFFMDIQLVYGYLYVLTPLINLSVIFNYDKNELCILTYKCVFGHLIILDQMGCAC